MSEEQRKIGLINGKFQPCPETSTCVSTQSKDEKHKIEPIYYKTTREEAKEKIINIISNYRGTKIVSQTDEYLHAEFRSLLFKFVDDVEFYFNDTEKVIHFRSASRIGGFDWGANRRRMERIRKNYAGL